MGEITKIKVNGDHESSYQLYPRNEEFAKRACGNTGSQSGVQPDWNQNDETAPDYVKNRPFYTGDSVETVLVEESTVTFAENSGLYEAGFPSTFEATVGETYKVSWDGTVYECTCVLIEGLPTIGNPSIMGAGSDTGEPFLMVVANGEGIQIITADTSASHTISISGMVAPAVKIDPKYIDDMYYTERFENSIEGIEIVDIPTYGTFDHNLPLEIGQVWSVSYKKLNGNIGSDPNYENLEVQLAEDGTLYLGAYPDPVGYPFSITTTRVRSNSSFVNATNASSFILTGVSGTMHEEVAHQIPLKYISAFEGNAIILPSNTENSTKRFKITVDDSGTLTATEVT